MEIKYADRVNNIKPSPIRELTKLTQQPGIISFAGGLPAAELFPIEELKKVDIDILDNQKSSLQYGPTEGYIPLRKTIADRMKKSGVTANWENILITTGSQQGLEFTGKLFINEGDTIVCESPSYIGALNAFKAYSPKFIEIPMDEDGMIVDELEKVLEKSPNIKFIYTIPDFQNPTGRTLSLDRRKRLVQIAAKYSIPIIEDNPYGELRFEGERLPAVKHFDVEGIVIYLGTFSKTFCPGLRTGWLIAEPETFKKYVLIKQGADLHSNTFAQSQIYSFINTYDIDKHIDKIIEVYRRRRDLMLDTMKKEFPPSIKYTYPNGGLFTWVDLPEELDAKEVLIKALKHKVAFVPGGSFYPNGMNENHFRLNYSSMPDDKIVEGIKILGNLLKTL